MSKNSILLLILIPQFKNLQHVKTHILEEEGENDVSTEHGLLKNGHVQRVAG